MARFLINCRTYGTNICLYKLYRTYICLSIIFFKQKSLQKHPKSVKKMMEKLRVLTNKGTGWSNENLRKKLAEFERGWIIYFSMADMKGLMSVIDEWLRRRIRAIYWKKWKKVKTRYRMLKALKLPEWKVHELANCRKGYIRERQ
jgi:RNA-directed DNA polymerase